jgi:hypothetical protein
MRPIIANLEGKQAQEQCALLRSFAGTVQHFLGYVGEGVCRGE